MLWPHPRPRIVSYASHHFAEAQWRMPAESRDCSPVRTPAGVSSVQESPALQQDHPEI